MQTAANQPNLNAAFEPLDAVLPTAPASSPEFGLSRQTVRWRTRDMRSGAVDRRAGACS